MLLTKDKGFYRSLLTLALPIALQNLITFSVGLFDNIMISSLGDEAVSGVYMGGQIQTLLQIFSAGTEGAILVLAAQYWGKADKPAIKKIISIGTRLSIIFGILVSIISAAMPSLVISLFTDEATVINNGAEYLGIIAYSFTFFCLTQSLIAGMRSVELPRVGLIVSALSLLINITFNYILIFGKLGLPALGIKGAAIATLIARITEAAVTLLYVFFLDKRLKLRPKDFLKFDRSLFYDYIKFGLPIILGQLVWAVNVLSNSAIMGRQNTEGVIAGLSIANTLHNLAYIVMNGLSGAVGIITGKTIGEGKEELIREYAKTVQILFLALGLVSGLALFVAKQPFISLYGVSSAAASEADTFINVLSVTVVGTSYQAACLFGLVKSGGDTAFVFKNDLFFVFLVVIPSALIATRLGLAPWIVFACLKSDQILKCIVAFIKINRYNWMKNLTSKRTD